MTAHRLSAESASDRQGPLWSLHGRQTEELRAAHDALAEFYAARLADALDHLPTDRAVLGLFCDLTLAAGLGTSVADIGCGTGRLEPYLAAKGLSPRGIDLSPEMIRVARRDHPCLCFGVAGLRDLPFHDASLAGVVCWYSLMYLAPPDRTAAIGELAHVVQPGGYLVTAFKAGDNCPKRPRPGNTGLAGPAVTAACRHLARTLFCGSVQGREPARGSHRPGLASVPLTARPGARSPCPAADAGSRGEAR